MSVMLDMQSNPGAEFVDGTEPIEELDAVAEDEFYPVPLDINRCLDIKNLRHKQTHKKAHTA
ncbi:hypothetical protein E4U51_008143 [Claviceps purpurea]|nr:hypothetical protein E4U51_008143 [Claviceps purpurea]